MASLAGPATCCLCGGPAVALSARPARRRSSGGTTGRRSAAGRSGRSGRSGQSGHARSAAAGGPTPLRRRRPRCRSSTSDDRMGDETAQAKPTMDTEEPERDEDGLYYGTYSTFFTDPEQLKGMVAFCGVLMVFFGGLQIISGLMLPVWFGGSRGVHPDVTSFDYWTKF